MSHLQMKVESIRTVDASDNEAAGWRVVRGNVITAAPELTYLLGVDQEAVDVFGTLDIGDGVNVWWGCHLGVDCWQAWPVRLNKPRSITRAK